MFFVFSKLLSFFLNPLFWIVLGFIFSWRRQGSDAGSILFKISFIALIFFSNPFVSNLALKYWEATPVKKDELPLSDIGIVLTGIISFDKKPDDQIHFDENVDRITESLSLYKSSIISKLLISGGSGSLLNQEIKEAEILSAFASNIVKSKDLLIEVESRNTYENALNSVKVLKSENLDDRQIILITSAFHMKRALACFEKQKLDVVAYPVDYRHFKVTPDIQWLIPSGSSIDDWKMIIKEQVGIWFYQLAGYI